VEIGNSFIESIMKDYEPIADSDGMKVLRNVVTLETGKTRDVVLRKITEPFWKSVIEGTETSRICAMGTPGVGKTTTSSILIRLIFMLNKGKDVTVIYHVRTVEKHGYVYIFTRQAGIDESIRTEVISQRSFDILNYNSESTFYVVDPGKTKDDCDPPSFFKGKVIIVASPDDKHWGAGEFIKDRDGVLGRFRILPVWRLEELQNTKEYFTPLLTNEIIEQRYELVGGVPRNIFSDDADFKNILNLQKTAIDQLNEDQVGNMIQDKLYLVNTQQSNQPKSAIMVYEDSGPKYCEYNPQPVTYAIRNIFYKKFGSRIWNRMNEDGVGAGTIGWVSFEHYCRIWFSGLMGNVSSGSFKQYIHKKKNGLMSHLKVEHCN
jgi:GTPase SAR1 family protein